MEATVQSGGPLAAYAIVVLGDSVPLLPTQPITLATGAAFGLGPGLAIVVCGQTTAAALCFSIGRSFLGPERLESLFGKKVTSIASEFTKTRGADTDDSFKKTFQSVLLFRQSPVIPFSVTNYVLGAATDAPLPAFVLGTALGCFPLNALYVATGAVVRGGAKAFLDKIGLDLLQAEEIAGSLGLVATLAIAYFLFNAITSSDNDNEENSTKNSN